MHICFSYIFFFLVVYLFLIFAPFSFFATIISQHTFIYFKCVYFSFIIVCIFLLHSVYFLFSYFLKPIFEIHLLTNQLETTSNHFFFLPFPTDQPGLFVHSIIYTLTFIENDTEQNQCPQFPTNQPHLENGSGPTFHQTP